MRIFVCNLYFLTAFLSVNATYNKEDMQKKIDELRSLCIKNSDLEKKITQKLRELDLLSQREKMTAPVVKNTHGMLSRCFTTIFNTERFSEILTVGYSGNKNDFVRASIIMKNFALYFNNVKNNLGKANTEVIALQKQRNQCELELKTINKEYDHNKENISSNALKIMQKREVDQIKLDIVSHISSKVESIEELDAELEAENTIGILKNSRVNTAEFKLIAPVNGKIIEEFGDKNAKGEMSASLSFQGKNGAIVVSPAKGCVVFVGKFLNYGDLIIISNGEYRLFIYGVVDVFVNVGDVVEQNDYLGHLSEKEPHILKMELRKTGELIDPRQWLNTDTSKRNERNI